MAYTKNGRVVGGETGYPISDNSAFPEDPMSNINSFPPAAGLPKSADKRKP